MNSLPFVLVNAVINFALILLFLRFMVQLAEIDKTHPFAKTTYRLTQVVDVFARIFPTVGKGRISTAAVVLMLLLYLINLVADAAILGKNLSAVEVFFVATISAIMQFLQALRYLMMASAISSLLMMFLNVNSSIFGVMMQLSEPIVAPFRRFVPNIGMIDLSFLVALFSLLLLEKFIGIISANIWLG